MKASNIMMKEITKHLDGDSPSEIKRGHSIAVLITCHDRKDISIACLDHLFQSQLPIGYCLEVFLVDDGSMDDTGLAVREGFPQVNVIYGDGSLYWNGGMRVAFIAAMEGDYDYYLWLNDDTHLYTTAVKSLIETSIVMRNKQEKANIVVGSTRDDRDGRLTYGGVTRPKRWNKIFFKKVHPHCEPIECESMNGNCVMISRDVAKVVGNLEKKFTHNMGDLDYGLRARSKGFPIWVMAGFAGTCSQNAVTDSFNNPALSMSARINKMLHPKGLPLSSWQIFTRRHAGALWPVYWLWPYAKTIIKGVFKI